MTAVINHIVGRSEQHVADRSTSFQPGGWGDRLVFGYMFRVITGLVAVTLPSVVVFAWGALNGWKFSSAMLWFFGISVGFIVVAGESLRIGAYESRLAKAEQQDTLVDDAQVTEPIANIDDGTLVYQAIKRACDIIFSALFILATVPINILVGLLVVFDSAGPAIYRTPQVGYKGRQYQQYRFRVTVHAPHEFRGHAKPLTRVGRFLRYSALDELPMLFNVLMGDMTFVGPRSAPPQHTLDSANEEIAAKYVEALRFLDHERPGLTGPDRLTHRHAAVQRYWQRRSIARDFSVIVRSVIKVLRGF